VLEFFPSQHQEVWAWAYNSKTLMRIQEAVGKELDIG
jgi:hypothetical protein